MTLSTANDGNPTQHEKKSEREVENLLVHMSENYGVPLKQRGVWMLERTPEIHQISSHLLLSVLLGFILCWLYSWLVSSPKLVDVPAGPCWNNPISLATPAQIEPLFPIGCKKISGVSLIGQHLNQSRCLAGR